MPLHHLWWRADEAGEVTKWGQLTIGWLADFVDSESPRVGQLAPRGRDELFGLGYRFGRWANATLRHQLAAGRRLLFTSTFKQRTIDSKMAFVGMCVCLCVFRSLGQSVMPMCRGSRDRRPPPPERNLHPEPGGVRRGPANHGVQHAAILRQVRLQ